MQRARKRMGKQFSEHFREQFTGPGLGLFVLGLEQVCKGLYIYIEKGVGKQFGEQSTDRDQGLGQGPGHTR